MKETIALESPRSSLALDEQHRVSALETSRQISHRSLIIWGEHCSECAAPACYSSCSFYSPRVDGHCRRFVDGIAIVNEPSLPANTLTHIKFRRWGKLEGRGPVRPVDSSQVATIEQQTRPAAGFGMAFLARREAWKSTEASRALVAGAATGFDCFLIEGSALSADEVAFTLTIVPADKSKAALFQTRFTLKRTWTRTTIPFADIARQIDLNEAHLIQIEPIGEAEGIEALFGHTEFVTWLPEAKPKGPSAPAKMAKVVVWDLDHTIWDGILLEDGAEGVSLRPSVRDAIEALDARGILQSVASKNNPDEALAALKHHGLFDYMLAPQIGWGPKSDSLNRIASILNLGLDSFVFIDDQPFERGEVSEAHAIVTVLDETSIATLLDRPQFDVPVTPESKGRRALYATEAERSMAAEQSGSDYDAFLRSCNLHLTIERLGRADSERVFELSQRTNQLNVAATRYTRDDVAAMVDSADGREAWTMRCQDRFGDYGLIGFALTYPRQGQIIDFFMSCRVQRKRVEAAFFDFMASRAASLGATSLSARYKKAARNGPSVELFEGLGFVMDKICADEGLLSKPIPTQFEGADIVAITLHEKMPEEAIL